MKIFVKLDSTTVVMLSILVLGVGCQRHQRVGRSSLETGAAETSVNANVINPRSVAGAPALVVCSDLDAFNGTATDASATLASCLDAVADGGTVELPAGKYSVGQPFHLRKSLSLRTRGK